MAVGREKRGNPLAVALALGGPTGSPGQANGRGRLEQKGKQGTDAKLDKTPTKFVFFKASPDESTVEVV